MQTVSAPLVNTTRTLNATRTIRCVTRELSSLERALLRLLMSGYSSEEAARSVGLSPAEAEDALRALQARFGVSGLSRLLALAVLRSWV